MAIQITAPTSRLPLPSQSLHSRSRFVWAWLLTCFLLSTPTTFAESPSKESNTHWALATTGLLLLVGGGSLAYIQNQAADRDMAVYRHSAFTENTTLYRERVQDHEKWTWVGLGCAALGGLVLVVSF